MIQPLRAAHRTVFLLWAVALPLLFAAGIVSRRFEPPPAGTAATYFEASAGRDRTPLAVRTLPDPGTGQTSVELSGAPPLVPDVLVYWTSQQGAPGLPEDARLLGAYRPGNRYPLPRDAAHPGAVLLYSLAHGELIANLPVAGAP